jgi:DNA-directed RNA polymerase subunit RPC12/RpoP
MPKITIMSQISNEQFEIIVKNSTSIKEVGVKCGYSNNGSGSADIVKKRIAEQQLDTSHFIRKTPVKRTDEEIFIENSPVDQRTLRQHYKNGNYTEYKCSICGQEPFWNGKELSLTLDHINGNNHDDRLENLRWVCPNCDRQLDTYGSKNIKPKEKEVNYCLDCGAVILKSSTRCKTCAAAAKSKSVNAVSREDLKKLIRTQPFTKLGEIFGVSDNAIRKWCIKYNLPKTKSDIQKYTDEEWELI